MKKELLFSVDLTHIKNGHPDTTLEVFGVDYDDEKYVTVVQFIADPRELKTDIFTLDTLSDVWDTIETIVGEVAG